MSEELMTSDLGTETDDSGATENEQEIVPFNEVGDEELDAILKASLDEEENPASEPEQSKEVAKKPEEQKKVEDDQNAPITRAEFLALQKRLDSQEKKVDGQELLLQRRTSELGDLKKRLVGINESLKEKLKEALQESPEDALDIRDTIKDNQKKIEQIDEHTQQIERRTETANLIKSHVPEGEFSVDDIAESLAQDGIQPQYIEQFKQDPIGFVDGDYNPGLVLIQMHKRARAEKTLKQLYDVAKKLVDENKKLRDGQGNVLKNIEKVAKQTPTITAGGGKPSGSSKTPNLSTKQIASLTDAELEEALANL